MKPVHTSIANVHETRPIDQPGPQSAHGLRERRNGAGGRARQSVVVQGFQGQVSLPDGLPDGQEGAERETAKMGSARGHAKIVMTGTLLALPTDLQTVW